MVDRRRTGRASSATASCGDAAAPRRRGSRVGAVCGVESGSILPAGSTGGEADGAVVSFFSTKVVAALLFTLDDRFEAELASDAAPPRGPRDGDGGCGAEEEEVVVPPDTPFCSRDPAAPEPCTTSK